MQLYEVLKQISANTMKEMTPTDILFGVVENTTPLKIRVNQKLILPAEFLVLSDAVRDHKKSVIIEGVMKEVTFLNALKVGEQVLLFKMSGGQVFYVRERVNA